MKQGGRESGLVMPVALPPAKRSRVALRLTAAAALGRFELQCCSRCAAVQYPPREACHRCLSVELQWMPQEGTGQLISETTLFHSHEAYFRRRLPWRVGLVRLDVGPTLVTHVHKDVPSAPTPVRVVARLDSAGQAALIARPLAEDTAMNDDPHVLEMSSDPRGRNVFVTDGTSSVGQALARALEQAGALRVWVGDSGAEDRSGAGRFAAPGSEGRGSGPGQGITACPFDVRNPDSVRRAAGAVGAEVGILINNSRHEGDSAREEMEVNYFGLLNLSEHFAPAMKPGGAWVNLLSINAMCCVPSQSTFSASMAAALSLSQGLRSRLRPAGIRVVNVFAGPIAEKGLAQAVVGGLREGVEDIYAGEVAQAWLTRWLESPKVLEREVAG